MARLLVVKGGAQHGKSTMIEGLLAGADMSGVAMRCYEFSSAMMGIVNRALAFQPVDMQNLEHLLLLGLRATIDRNMHVLSDIELNASTELNDVRHQLDAWYRRVGPDFLLTEANKDANRIVLTWLAVVGRLAAKDEAIFAYPVLQRLEADGYANIEYACVGGLRYPDELAALEREHMVIVAEVVSDRVAADTDPANAKKDLIRTDVQYSANFQSPEASQRFAAEHFWPDFLGNTLGRHYGATS